MHTIKPNKWAVLWNCERLSDFIKDVLLVSSLCSDFPWYKIFYRVLDKISDLRHDFQVHVR